MKRALSEAFTFAGAALLGAGATADGFWGGAASGVLFILSVMMVCYVWQASRR
jgi:hypothetical protein